MRKKNILFKYLYNAIGFYKISENESLKPYLENDGKSIS